MKVKTSKATVEKLAQLLESYDASTEQFLDDLPTPEKYAVLAMALVVKGQYDDFEMAYDESMHTVPAQELTRHFFYNNYCPVLIPSPNHAVTFCR